MDITKEELLSALDERIEQLSHDINCKGEEHGTIFISRRTRMRSDGTL